MALIVQKFGGTSVGTVERIKHVADKVVNTQGRGHQMVVVVSAMSGETDRLIQLAKAIDPRPKPRELDVLLATGEQVTIALLSMALEKKGVLRVRTPALRSIY
jgi:Aspartokinases